MNMMYFNDTDKPKRVYLYTFDPDNYHKTVEPQTYTTFNIDIPNDKGLFFKEWTKDIILIATYDLPKE